MNGERQTRGALVAYRLESDLEPVGCRYSEVELLEADDAAGPVLHEDDLFTGLFADILVLSFAKPDRQSVTFSVVEYLHLTYLVHRCPLCLGGERRFGLGDLGDLGGSTPASGSLYVLVDRRADHAVRFLLAFDQSLDALDLP